MQSRYCVYNQTNECFLSLGALLGDSTFARLKALFGRGLIRANEGCWIRPAKAFQTLVIFSSRDLVYLDEAQRVVQVVESFNPFRNAPPVIDAASVLVLPARTIRSSQTKSGNQLLICAAEEMESRLKDLRETATDAPSAPAPSELATPSPLLPKGVVKDRRNPMGKRRRCRVAYNAGSPELPSAYSIRDVSPTGLYLVTRERWPLGTAVHLKLESIAGMKDKRARLSVPMRVSRWGTDGVGLEFIAPNLEYTAMIAMQARQEGCACNVTLDESGQGFREAQEVNFK